MGDPGGAKEVHLLLCGAHEEEAGGVEQLVQKSAVAQRLVILKERDPCRRHLQKA